MQLKNLRWKGCTVLLIFILLAVPVNALFGTESGYKFNLNFISGNSDLKTSGFMTKESGYKVNLNFYTEGFGGKYKEGNYKVYLVPESAYIPPSHGILTNIDSDIDPENANKVNFALNPKTFNFMTKESGNKVNLNFYTKGFSGKYEEGNYNVYLVPESAYISHTCEILPNDPGCAECAKNCDVYCSNCDDCEAKLGQTDVTTVCLNSNITEYSGTCIDNPANFTNKTFDCQRYTIDGTGTGYGIHLDGKTNNALKNCLITGFVHGFYLEYFSNSILINNTANYNFGNGIYLDDSSNNNLISNTANYNVEHAGIYLTYSSNNTLINNTANGNTHGDGIYLGYSSNNTLINNTANSNYYSGIALDSNSDFNDLMNNNMENNEYDGIHFHSDSNNNNLIENLICGNDDDIDNADNSNSGDNNTCDSTYTWNDTGTTYCTYTCTTHSDNICYCSNCDDCEERLNDASCTIVILTANVTTHSGSCINNPPGFNNKIFDCHGHTINGTGSGNGIYLNGRENNTIKNCIITDFSVGIRLSSSSNNTLTSNTVNDNNNHGIYINNADDNNLNNNNITNNNNTGVYFSSGSTNNDLTGNFICSNGLDVNDSDSNTGDNNTCDTTYNWNDTGATNCTNACGAAPSAPSLTFVSPTPANGTTICRDYAEINISIAEENLDTFKFNWNNENYSFYDDSLVLGMNFNNNSADDFSKYGNDGTINGAIWDSTGGKYGGAFEFDGVDDYVEITSDSLSVRKNLTVSSWVRNTDDSFSDGSPNYFISKGPFHSSPWTDYSVRLRSNYKYSFSIYTDQGSYEVSTAYSYNDNNSHLVTAVYDYTDSEIRIYVDGVFENYTSAQGTIQNSNNSIYIGDWIGNSIWHFWHGTIDEVRIYNRSLSANEIKMHYYSNLQKYNSTQWYFYSNITNLTEGDYTYYGWANDSAGNENTTETRHYTHYCGVPAKYCDSCSNCTTAIQNAGAGDIVKLTKDISSTVYGSGSCINWMNNNITFDCQNHTINKTEYIGHGSGIYIGGDSYDHNIIKNCKIDDFQYGIYLSQGDYNTFENNWMINNHWSGIHMLSADNNEVMNNEVMNNDEYGIYIHSANYNEIENNEIENHINYGIYIESANNNTLNNNTVCNNTDKSSSDEADIRVNSGSENSGDNNTCSYASGWNDDSNPNGCRNICNSTAGCDSCTHCTNTIKHLDSRITVELTKNISSTVYGSGSCINWMNNNITFDCQNHTINKTGYIGHGSGIYIGGDSYDHNIIKNCKIEDFQYGIYLSQGDYNTFENNEIMNNHYSGISINSADNNEVMNNEVMNNDEYGIYIQSANYNEIENNEIENHINYGIYIESANNNTLNNNTVCNNTDKSSADEADIRVNSGSENSGDNNTCNYASGWNDDSNPNGCRYICNDTAGCDSCTHCTNTIKHLDSRITVKLTKDISSTVYGSGICINWMNNNITFDCQNNTINKTGYIGHGSGIYIGGDSYDHNIIKNCKIEDFQYGIYLSQGDYNIFENNWIINNHWSGIYIVSADNNEIRNNEVRNNDKYGIYINSANNNEIMNNEIKNHIDSGIYINSANNNTLNNNTVCNNTDKSSADESDIRVYSGSENSGDNNTCSYASGWNDDSNPNGCRYICNDTAGCDSCSNCTTAIQNAGAGEIVKLTKDISTTGTCINWYSHNVTFDCQGYKISGDGGTSNYGIRLYDETYDHNTIKNCKIENFYYGIYLYQGDNNTFENNKIRNNTQGGIFLFSNADDNKLNNNEIKNNDDFGIYMSSANYNEIENNKIENHINYGIYIVSANNNTLNNNTVCNNTDKSSSDEADIRVNSGSENSGDNNTCNTTSGYQDATTGVGNCTYACGAAQSPTCGCDKGTYSYTCGETITKSCTLNCSLNSTGTCFTIGANDIIIDGGGYSITGDGGFGDYGIYLNGRTNVTIKNFNISNFYIGIHLYFSSNNNITNNTANNNNYGIYLNNADSNNLTSNTAKYNNRQGIELISTSTGNTINSNTFCSNDQSGGDYYDIEDNGLNSGDNNTCDTTSGWGDTGFYEECRYDCGSSEQVLCECNSCDECVFYLNSGLCSEVKLTANITNYVGSCIANPANFTSKTFDCQGHTIDGTGSGHGITPRKGNNTIKNCIITDFEYGIGIYSDNNSQLINNTANDNEYGIYLLLSSNNTLTGNTANSNTKYGIHLDHSSENTLTNNTANNNEYGIYLFYSSNNNITNNTAYAGYVGIRLSSSSNNTLTGNTVSNAAYGIQLSSSSSNNTLTGNTANNNSWYGLYVAGSSNNTLAGNTVNSNWNTGIFLGYSPNNTLAGNNVNSNWYYGINLNHSPYNTLIDNTANNNKWGIHLYFFSKYNTLTNNTANNNTGYGIYLVYSSDHNTLTNNTANDNNKWGIHLNSSSSNTLAGNAANSNNPNYHGIYLYDSDSNTLTGNTANNNKHGIYLVHSSSNILENNTANNNHLYGIYSYAISSDNTLTNNTANGNWDGIRLNFPLNNTLAGNTVNSNIFYGIYLGRYSRNNSLTGNTANDNRYGIYLNKSSNNTLTGNTANNNTWYGIYLYNHCYLSSYNILTGNTASNNKQGIFLNSSSNIMTNNTANSNEDYGIYIDGLNNNLAGNTANDNYHGIYLTSGGRNNLTNNTASNNTRYGIYLKSSSGNILTGNTANDNYHGIHLYYYGSRNIITNNTANNNTWYGIHLYYYPSNNNLTGNTANNNTVGIHLLSSSNNNLTGNTANYNSRQGIYLSSTSTGNTINSNTFCDNNQSGGAWYDICGVWYNSGDNNTCDTTDNWNDNGTTGCTYACPGYTITNLSDTENLSAEVVNTGNDPTKSGQIGVQDVRINQDGNPVFDVPVNFTGGDPDFSELTVNSSNDTGKGIVVIHFGNASSAHKAGSKTIYVPVVSDSGRVCVDSDATNVSALESLLANNCSGGDWVVDPPIVTLNGNRYYIINSSMTDQVNGTGGIEKPILCDDINNDGIITQDYDDLMTAYKCFLGINKNCNDKYQNWKLMKQEYECFIKNDI